MDGSSQSPNSTDSTSYRAGALAKEDHLVDLVLQRRIRIGVAGEHYLEQLPAVRCRQDARVEEIVARTFRILARRNELQGDAHRDCVVEQCRRRHGRFGGKRTALIMSTFTTTATTIIPCRRISARSMSIR